MLSPTQKVNRSTRFPNLAILTIAALLFVSLADIASAADRPDPKIFLRDCLRNGQMNKADGELFCWHAASAAETFLDAYEAYQDPAWLVAASQYYDFYLGKLEKDPDGREGWIGNTIGNDPNIKGDALVGDAILCSPLVRYAEIVMNDPRLKAKYAAKARHYARKAEQIIWRKWNERGCYYEDNGLGSYHTHHQYIDVKTGKWTPRPMSVVSDNLNKHYDAGLVLLRLWRLTGKEEYRQRVETIFNRHKTMIRYFPDEDRSVWNYWMPHGPYDVVGNSTKSWVAVHPHRAGYQAGETSDFIEVYDSGLVFEEVDIERMIRTNLWMSTGKMDGSPGFRSADATSDAGTLWSALARFSPEIEKMYLKNLKGNKSPHAVIALAYYQNVVKKRGWDRAHMKPNQEPKVFKCDIQPGTQISMALVIPSTVEIANEDRVALATKVVAEGKLTIELLAADSDEVLGKLHEQQMARDVQFTAPRWDGTNPKTGKREVGNYRIRWTLNGESRIEQAFVIVGTKKEKKQSDLLMPGDTITYDFEKNVDKKWSLQGAKYARNIKHSGNRSLRLEQGNVAVLKFGDYEDLPVRITMMVYDDGRTFDEGASTNGPGWGVQMASGDKFAVRRFWRGYLDGNNQTAWLNTAEGQWFNPHITRIPRVKGWNKWVFDFTDPDNVTVSGDGVATNNLVPKFTPKGAVSVYLIGGSVKAGPLYVDDITVEFPSDSAIQ